MQIAGDFLEGQSFRQWREVFGGRERVKGVLAWQASEFG